MSCHRINSYGWPDPDPVSHGCNATEKPREVETCIINGDCKHKPVLWKVGLWEPVSYNCNQITKIVTLFVVLVSIVQSFILNLIFIFI